ncbi:unnamed protein product [Gordionus sp. m RMFG-2023]
MDSMELERQRGITIKSAATYIKWNNHFINIIDTPGHVDFTIEVERALRVLDSAVLVLCAVAGVQCQTHTVVRQMNRYSIPYIAFINKLDRTGANPYAVLQQIKNQINENSAFLQIPISYGDNNRVEGIIDLIRSQSVYFKDPHGTQVIKTPDIPQHMASLFHKYRRELIETLGNVDEEMACYYINEQCPSPDIIEAAIKRSTILRKFVPVILGSALKNTGVQTLLDCVTFYLPDPTQKENYALDNSKKPVEKILLNPDMDKSLPFVALAFKLEVGKHGNVTYLRTYQGALNKGDTLLNTRTRKRVKASRVIKMHSDELQEVAHIPPGDICAIIGNIGSTGDTFVSGEGVEGLSCESMFVPEPVVSMSIKPDPISASSNDNGTRRLEAFGKAMTRFAREDPTFRVVFDEEAQETIVQGMGELHLEIYKQRMEREYGVKCIMGAPKVAFRETITTNCEFDYLHKKQHGGSGQYGRIIGNLEPLPANDYIKTEFVDNTVGTNIPNQFISSIEKGFNQVCQKGFLSGHKISGVRFNLLDGDHHIVDSNDISFVMAAFGAIKQTFEYGTWTIIEPIMKVEVNVPSEFQGILIATLSRKNSVIIATNQALVYFTMICEVPLNNMFGFASELRSITQGKGEFTMEYSKYAPALPETQNKLIQNYSNSNSQQIKSSRTS